MSLKPAWLMDGLRVLTRNGPGRLSKCYGGVMCEVELDEPVAGRKIIAIEYGEIVLESNFTLIRAINCGGLLITNAQNYPSWEETLEALFQPFSQDETLIALNFQERILKVNRLLPPCFHLLEVYFDMYWPSREQESEVYSESHEARRAWQRIDGLSGTSDHILLCILIDLETSRILARAIFSALKTITKEVWW